ncbi:hypothetical protein GDO78_023095 [Eleutherodactylus coqui]|uniref:Taste receptor type 2 n=1 Tax=Eleutherodactylus coqui TaxID=57060 RepID=A0A8J6EFN0_ELECQ|nr:hypothetical protein GDO78_023095 [Eleutherodactylus coqui]
MEANSIRYILLAVLSVICLLGLTGNLLIVAANFMKWKSLKSLQTSEKILSSLAISRGLYFFTILMWNFFFRFFPKLAHRIIVLSVLYILNMCTFYSSLWIATILCVFYCVKIVAYNYKLFIILKTRISTMAPWLLQASLLISLICSLPFGWYGYHVKLKKSSNGTTENMMEQRLATAKRFNERFLVFAVGSFPPFLIFCAANLMLIHFLLMHTRRMRGNESNIQSPNLKSYFNVLKSMSLFLLLQIMSFICMSVFISGKLHHFDFSILIGRIILCSPPLFHSLYLISSSSEVKKMFTLLCLGLFRYS